MWSQATGAFEVHGLITDKYVAAGGAGRVGFPLTNETTTPDGIGRYDHFSGRRSIYWRPPTDAHVVGGPIRARWAALVGYPTTDPLDVPGGQVSHFQRGSLYWHPATGVQAVLGAIAPA